MHSLIKFAITGVLNTAIGLGTIYALKYWLDWSDTLANLTGYCVGFIVSTVVNARWTFEYRASLAPAALKYAVVIVTAYLVNLGVVHLAIGTFGVNSYLAQALGVPPYAVLTYLGAKYWVFVSSDAQQKAPS
jgi:putative flippase GtrA